VVSRATGQPANPEVATGRGAGGLDAPLAPVERRAAGDIALRVYLDRSGAPGPCAPAAACSLTPTCSGTSLLIEASAAAWADAFSSPDAGRLPPGAATLETNLVVGAREGGPSDVAVVDVDPAVSVVALDVIGGGTDRAAPVDGQAVLAAAIGRNSGADPTVVIVADGPNGAVQVADGSADSIVTRPSCAAATSTGAGLPAPGGQPAEPAAARAAIAKSYALVFGGGQGPTWTQGWDPAMAAATADATNKNPGITTTAVVTRIVFTNPTTAAVEYDLVVHGGPDTTLPGQIGGAVLVGDRWLVTRDTSCHLLQLAGETC
jgi:hypothetical protein